VQVAQELHLAQARSPSKPMSTLNTQGIDQLLQELNRLAAQASGQAEPAADGAEFGAALQAALQQVNAAQQEATRLQQEFDLNAPNVNLHDVMVSLQKASLSFQTMVQVRNRLVSAYQEVMNMQV
jgi:flagellar hook-basal body complex protein FliE